LPARGKSCTRRKGFRVAPFRLPPSTPQLGSVDVAHIHQFASSRNNALNNGISLSKNAHWLFDNGLWSIRDDYTVLIAERHFAEAGDSAFLLARMKGRKITLPANPSHWPSPQHLAWHRSHKFLGG
jgi:putative restriction endonuclease